MKQAQLKPLLLGYGYVARHWLNTQPTAQNTQATYRRAETRRDLESAGVHPIAVDDPVALANAVHTSNMIVVSAPPLQGVCPMIELVQAALGDAAPHALADHVIVYLSTTGVYGDHAGAWVDESTSPNAPLARAQARLVAEQQWQKLAPQTWVLRLAGIYGNERSPFKKLAQPPIRKQDYVSGRIHVADIAQAMNAAHALHAKYALARTANVVDSLPAPPHEVLAFAADLANRPLPAAVEYHDALKQGLLSPMAQSFYLQCRRVSNARLLALLQEAHAFDPAACTPQLIYPTYREGLHAIWHAPC